MKKRRQKFFTGIGSRKTPPEADIVLMKLSRFLVKKGYRLRSGHADGADRACELGANGDADIYLPWASFGQKAYRSDPGMDVIGDPFVPEYGDFPKRLKLIKQVCKESGKTKFGKRAFWGQRLLFRNVFQVLGHKKKYVPSDVVICYHENTGGTLYAIDIAIKYGVPILNVRGLDYVTAKKKLKEILKRYS
jgi:hypothetical protein